MSVKIGHGHVYTGAEPFDIFEFTESLRPAFADVAARLDARALVRGAFKAHEDSLRSNGRPAADALLASYRAFDDEQRALAAEGWYRADMLRAFRPHEATLSIGRPYGQLGNVLMLINADAGEYFEALRARDDVKEYSYTTSHDTLPAGVTRAQYRARGEEWERLFGKGPILENTVSVEFRSAHDSTMRRMASKDRTADDVELLRDEVPDTDDRARRIVNELLINEWSARRRAAEPDADAFDGVMSALYDISMADRDELIELAASTITPSSELLEHFLNGTATLGSPGLMSLSLAARDWLDTNPIGEH